MTGTLETAPAEPWYKRRAPWILLALSLALTLIWTVLAHPYRPFPSDDRIFAWNPNAKIHMPLYVAMLHVMGWIWGLFSGDWMSSLLLLTAVFHAVTTSMLGLVTWRQTRSLPLSAATILVFGTSSWTVIYYHFAFYVPVSTALVSTAVFLAFRSREKGVDERRWLAAAGATAALTQWTSPSGLVDLAAVGVLVAVITFERRWRPWLRRLFYFSAPALGVVLLYAAIFWRQYLAHLHENLNSDHMKYAIDKWGYVPTTPFWSFFRMAWYHSPLLMLTALVALIVLAALKARERGARLERRAAIGVFALILFHALAVDVLPFTKLARTHFPIYGFVVVGIALVTKICAEAFVGIRRRLIVASVLVLGIVTASGVSRSVELTILRMSAADVLYGYLAQGGRLYALTSDPAKNFLGAWLGVELQKINTAAEIPQDPRPAAIIIGPRGKHSGVNLLTPCALPDYDFDERLVAGMRQMDLAFHPFYPGFMFEEEICTGLYFEGRIPDYKKDPGLAVRVYY